MAKDKEPLEAFIATAAEIAEQTTTETQGAMENYFGWLQKAMSTFPWSNTNLNVILLRNATQTITATFAFVHKLSQAKNFEDVVKIQTEFMEAQLNSFNEQAKTLSEMYTKAAADAMKTPFDVRK
jgi:Phasin protein